VRGLVGQVVAGLLRAVTAEADDLDEHETVPFDTVGKAETLQRRGPHRGQQDVSMG
jgi:hypothetical protein